MYSLFVHSFGIKRELRLFGKSCQEDSVVNGTLAYR